MSSAGGTDLHVLIRKTNYDEFGEESMKTGQDVLETGLYASECCGVEIILEKDACFPRCRKCLSLSMWEEVEAPEQKAA